MLDWSSPTDVVFVSEGVKTLKQHCKDVAINGQLCWRIEDQCIYYGIMEELLQWAHEGNKLYSKRYPGKVDYKSKRNEAITLSVLFAWEEASKVLEGIRDNLDSKPWEGRVSYVHFAALHCSPEYAIFIHGMLKMCYRGMLPKPFEGKLRRQINLGKLQKHAYKSNMSVKHWREV